MFLERSAVPTTLFVPTLFFFGMSGSHVSLPALDIEREQKEIDMLIATLQQYRPATRNTRDSNSATCNSSTPKSAPAKPGRGRPAKNKEVPSSPVVPVPEFLPANSFEVIIDCLNKLNSQNQKLSKRVTELDEIVKEQSKTIETLQTKVTSSAATDPSTVDVPAPANELFNTVVKRVEKIEDNINLHLLLCRGPAVTSKITDSTVNNVVDLEKVKAEICAEVCGETVSKISVSAIGISIYGKK